MKEKLITIQKEYVLKWHNSLMVLFFEANEICYVHINLKLTKPINDCVKKGENLARSLRKDSKPKEKTIRDLEENCKELKTLMDKGIKNLRMYYKGRETKNGNKRN